MKDTTFNKWVQATSQSGDASPKFVSPVDRATDRRVNYDHISIYQMRNIMDNSAVYQSLRLKPTTYMSQIKEEISGGSSLTLRLSEKVNPKSKIKNFILRNKMQARYPSGHFSKRFPEIESEVEYRTFNIVADYELIRPFFSLKNLFVADIKENGYRYISQLRFVCDEDFVLQSGFTDEKAMNRQLYNNSRISSKKQKKKDALRHLYWNKKKYPKCEIIDKQIASVCKKMEIQYGIKDILRSRDISCHIENFISYIVAIKDANSIVQFLCITNLFLGCYMDSSRVLQSIDYFKYLFDIQGPTIQLETQSGHMTEIKRIIADFKSYRHCETAKRIHKFISYILALGLCGTNNLTFTVGNFEVFHIGCVKQKDLNFLDIIEIVFDTIIYFVERGYQAFQTGDPWQLLYGDDMILDFEKNLSFINSHIQLIESGNLELLPMQVDEFEDMVTKLKNTVMEMLKANPSGTYHQILVVKLGMIDRVNVKLLQARRNVAIRERPFSLLLFGGSGIGKSTMLNIILNQLMRVNGFDPNPEKINSLNASDQYQSDYRSDSTCVIFDDIANATMQTAKGNHCQMIIDFINNNPKCALKASVDEKGTCPIRPKIVVGTTNVKTMMANQYSNEPVSIARRFDVTITVTVKDEYRLPFSDMIDEDKVVSGDKDCWWFKVEKVIPCFRGDGAAAGIGYTLVEDEGILLDRIDMKHLLKYLTKISKKHFLKQKEVVQFSQSVFKIPMCETCQQYPEFCTCHMEHQTKDIQEELKDLFTFTPFVGKKNSMFPGITKMEGIMDTFSQLYDKTKIVGDIITNLEQYAGVENIYKFHSHIKENYPYLTFIIIWPLISVLFLLGLMFSSIFMFFFFALTACKFIKTWNWWVERKIQLFALKDNAISILRTYNTDRVKRNIAIGTLGVISVVAIKKIYDLVRTYNLLKVQGSEEVVPVPMPDERPENVWKKPYVSEIPKSVKVKTTTSTVLTQLVAKNIVYFEGTNTSTNTAFFSDIFPIKSNLWLINSHALPDNVVIRGRFVRHTAEYHGGNFNAMISPINTVHIPNTDLALLYIPSGGDNKDFSDFLPLDLPNKVRTPAKLIYKNEDGLVDIQEVNAKFSRVGTEAIQVMGHSYTTQKPTFKGLCMAVLIADGTGPEILGFHFAGTSGKCIGASSMLLREQLDEAIYQMSIKPSILISHSTGDFIPHDVGPFPTHHLIGGIHEKSPLNFLPDGAVFRAYGKHDGARKTYKSTVSPSVISDSVEQVMGQPNIWGPPPDMKGWQNWNRDLGNMSHPKELEPTLLACAAADYQSSLLKSIPQERIDRISPLTDDAAISGVDGVFGLDCVNMQSSCGLPINKPKNKVLSRSNIPRNGISQPIDIPPYLVDEIRRMEDVLASGRRDNIQFSACIKDEPTKNTKKKGRIFCGSPIAATHITRKYFLPICKMMMENSYLFECAVGINAHGKDWDELARNIQKYGPNRMIAGDYSDYDSTMPASITLAAFGILIDIARRAGYSERQLEIMRGLATEICYPTYEYNGEYIQILGSNPSGQALTVFINSICNSLYMRIAYYSIYRYSRTEIFNEHVSLMTYGDDNIMSVSEDRPEFTHTSIAAALANYDISYTMADKTAASIPYIHLSQTSFLKRQFVFSEEYGIYLAPIEEMSLFKTLHSHLASKELTKEEHAANAIECVLREWFLFGEEVFNQRRMQLLEIAKKHTLMHHFRDNQLLTFDYLDSEFRNKYLTQDISPKSDPLAGKSSAWNASTLILIE
ncbi:putative RNA-dependent RNA polymerase [Freshwater macrophyte associated picorna-like virus 16]|nr:putative RNA-dependent RNA polymerase [Freshwater macrophyte associated picorna-like virus 16]